jgi:hypothetical protein
MPDEGVLEVAVVVRGGVEAERGEVHVEQREQVLCRRVHDGAGGAPGGEAGDVVEGELAAELDGLDDLGLGAPDRGHRTPLVAGERLRGVREGEREEHRPTASPLRARVRVLAPQRMLDP